MNLLQLVLKQMRQRALSTWLTFLSVTLGVALAIAILLLYREGDKLFTQADFGFDVVVGPKTGGGLTLVLNSVYQIGSPTNPIGYDVVEKLQKHDAVRWALPWAVGDNYRGYRVIGTSPAVLGQDEDGKPLPADQVFEHRLGRKLEVDGGRAFHPRKFEAVIGAEVAAKTDLRVGAKFKPSHGAEVAGVKDEHDEQWEVVGVLKRTNTAMDRLIFVPLISAVAVPKHAEVLEQISDLREADEHDHDHAPATKETAQAEDHDDHAGHEHHDHIYHMNEDGTIELHLEKEKWGVSAVLVRTNHGQSQRLIFETNNSPSAQAVNPAWEMRQFFDGFMKGSRALLLSISALVTVVAAVGILVSIYNSVSARLKEIAVLRALGATRLRVLALICTEAAMVGLIGGVAGLITGHLLGAAGNVFFRRYVGESLNVMHVGGEEIAYVGVVVVIAALAGLVPALKAYKTPVATNLTA